MADAIAQQMDEFACVLSMFPGDGELVYDAQLQAQYERFLAIPHTAPEPVVASRFTYTVRFINVLMGGHVPELEIKYPAAYPVAAQAECVVHCASLPRAAMEALQTELLCIATGHDGEPVALQLYQCMADALEQQTRRSDTAEAEASSPSAVAPPSPRVLGRRAIYFHHIIAPSKRRVVKEWALELALGGFSKIGWPGLVVVEGDEARVQEYVRRLQHLQWKQMAVRGEQTERVESIDGARRLPRGFGELGETAMAEAAALCRAAGLEDLFLSTMKIYRSPDATARDDGGDSRRTNGKSKRASGGAKR